MAAAPRYVKLTLLLLILLFGVAGPAAMAQMDDEDSWEETPFQEALRQGEEAFDQWKLEDAEREFRRALTLIESEAEEDRAYALAYARVYLSRVLDAMHREEDALEVHDLVIEALPDPQAGFDDEDTADMLREHADLLMQLGRWDEAEEFTDKSFKHAQEWYGEDDPWALSYLMPRIAILMQTQRQGEAIKLHKRLIGAYEKAYGSTHPGLMGVLNAAAYDAALSGESEQALEWFERVLGLDLNENHETSQALTSRYAWVSSMSASSGDMERAIEAQYKMIDLFERAYGEEDRNVADGFAVLANLQVTAGEPADALKSLDKTIEIIGDGEQPDRLLVDALMYRAGVLRLLDRNDEADEALAKLRAAIAR